MSKPSFINPFSSTSRPVSTSLPKIIDDDEEDSLQLPLPPPLDRSMFLGESFDITSFLQGRRHLGLDELRMELRSYLATLRQSLIEIINADYEQFISLSLGLRRSRVPLSLSSLLEPIMQLHGQISKVKIELESMRSELNEGLEQRTRVRELKGIGRRMLELDEGVERVERLLKIGEVGKASNEIKSVDRHLESPARRIERIAGEYNQMLYLVDKAGVDLPFVTSLQPRISKMTNALQLDLSTHFTTILHLLVTASSHQISTTSSSLSIVPASTLNGNGTTTLQSPRDSLTSILRTYVSLGLSHRAEEKIREEWVKPWCARMIRKDNFLASQKRTRRRKGGLKARNLPIVVEEQIEGELERERDEEEEGIELEDLFENLLDFMEDSRGIGLLLEVAESSAHRSRQPALTRHTITARPLDSSESSRKYYILSNVVWDEMGKRLGSELGTVIFAAGRPDIFHRNYVTTTEFMGHIESLCPSLEHLDAFRSHPTTIAFLKRWQLPVYYQLRFGEIVKFVEKSLESSIFATALPVPTSSTTEIWSMNGSQVIWTAIEKCWSKKVWLEELNPKFWRLSLQLLSRYRTWLQTLAPDLSLTASDGSLNAALGNRPSLELIREKDRLSNLPFAASLNNSPSRSNTPAPIAIEDANAIDEGKLRLYSGMIMDVTKMQQVTADFFQTRISACLELDEFDKEIDGNVSLQETLSLSLASLASFIPHLSSQIVSILTARALDPLKHVKSIANQARASTRRPGVVLEPSFFVRQVLKDLTIYVEGVGKGVGDARRSEWIEKVVESVILKYTALLIRQKEIDDSLRQLKKGRQGGSSFFSRSAAPSSAVVEDEEGRVRLQMQTDVEELGREAERLGVDVENNQEFAGLRNAC